MTTLETTTSKKTVPTWKLVVWTFLSFVLIAGLTLIARKYRNEPAIADQKIVQDRLEKLGKLRKEEHETVTTYSWVDKPGGVVRIPVDAALPLALKELQAKTVQKSAVPVVPVVAPATTPAPAAGVKK